MLKNSREGIYCIQPENDRLGEENQQVKFTGFIETPLMQMS